jgi:pimeloyl-ACP methyl ester carboxylesterase
MREGKLAVSGAELRYDEAGQGPPMVLVHGSGVSGATWGGVLAPLAEAGFRVIAYDRRGYGGSIHRPVRDFRIHVADLLALLQQLDEPAHVVGWSSGSSAALAIAAERPDLLRSVTVIEAPWHGLRHATLGMFLATWHAQLLRLGRRPEEGALAFFRWACGLSRQEQLPPEIEAEVRAHARVVLSELDPHPFSALMESVPTRRLTTGSAPITWLLSSRTHRWYSKIRAAALRNAPRIAAGEIPGAGHLAHIDAPEAFVSAVLDSLHAEEA